MSAPKSPQEALRIQRVAVTVVWVSVAAMVLIAVLVLVNTPTMSWGLKVGMVGVIGMFAMVFAAFLSPARAAVDNSHQHCVGDSAHHCQCRDCGRTFTPAPSSPTGPPHAVPTPQQRAATARSMLRMAPFAGLVLLLTLMAALIIESSGWFGRTDSLLQFVFSDALVPIFFTLVMVFFVGVGLMVIVLVSRAQRNSMDREIASYSPQHGCTCTWCGRKNTAFANTRGQYHA